MFYTRSILPNSNQSLTPSVQLLPTAKPCTFLPFPGAAIKIGVVALQHTISMVMGPDPALHSVEQTAEHGESPKMKARRHCKNMTTIVERL